MTKPRINAEGEFEFRQPIREAANQLEKYVYEVYERRVRREFLVSEIREALKDAYWLGKDAAKRFP